MKLVLDIAVLMTLVLVGGWILRLLRKKYSGSADLPFNCPVYGHPMMKKPLGLSAGYGCAKCGYRGSGDSE